MDTPEKPRKRTPGEVLYVVFSGMAMGAADVVPGVSGGTMAFILGIYEELLNTIKSVNITLARLVLKGRFLEALRHVNGVFLIALGTGLALAIGTLAHVVTWLYEHHPQNLFSFFFGLVLASIFVIGAHVRWRLPTMAGVVAGTLIAYAIVRMVPVTMPNDPLTLLWCGAIAIMAMILPGISGSFILLILGQYHFILSKVKEPDLVAIFPVAVGAVIGLLAFSRVVSWLLKTYHQMTISFLVGFMVGSLWKIWPFRRVLETMDGSHGELVPVREQVILPDLTVQGLVIPALLCVAGIVLVLSLESLQKRVHTGHHLGG